MGDTKSGYEDERQRADPGVPAHTAWPGSALRESLKLGFQELVRFSSSPVPQPERWFIPATVHFRW